MLPEGTVTRLKADAGGQSGAGTHPLAGRVVIVGAYYPEVGFVIVESSNGFRVWTTPSDVVGWPS
jgi:hypothetical protein